MRTTSRIIRRLARRQRYETFVGAAILTILATATVCASAFVANVGVLWAQESVPDLEQLEVFNFPFENVDLKPVVTAIALSPDKTKLYVGGDDRRVYSWNVASKEVAPVFKESDDWIRSIGFSPTEDELATLSQDGELKIWNPQTQQTARAATEKTIGARALAYSPNGKVIAVCGFERSLYIFDAATLKVLTIWNAPSESSTTICFSDDGTLLAVAGRNGIVRVWTTEDGKVAQDFHSSGNRRVRAVAFSPDGTLVAAAGDGKLVEVWNVKDGRKVADLEVDSTQASQNLAEKKEKALGKIFSATFCGNDKIATGDSLNVVKIWSLAEKKTIAQGFGHTGTIAVLQFDPTDSTLLSGSFDTTVIKWKIP